MSSSRRFVFLCCSLGPVSLLFLMKIVSWNVQGAASRGFRRALLLLVNKVKADLVGLVEPRISGILFKLYYNTKVLFFF